MPFSLSCKNVFLTYPNFLISPNDFLDQFRNLPFVASKDFKYTIGCEAPETTEENYHVHALISFSRKIRSRNERDFDVGGHHPNIQAAIDVEASHAYVHKGEGDDAGLWTGCGDGDGVLCVCSRNGGEEPDGGEMGWGALLDCAENREGFLSAVRRFKPRDFVVNRRQIDYFVECHFPTPPTAILHQPEYDTESFLPHPELDAWCQRNLVSTSTTTDKSLYPTLASLANNCVGFLG